MRSASGCTRRLAAGLTLCVGVLLSSVPAAHATWVSENCRDGSSERNAWKRSDAYDYAQPARKEGYEWNGGCYKLNDRDDTDGWPVDAEGEGADCSGFVFKVWALKRDASPGFRQWDHQMDVHGPYSTWQYVDPQPEDRFKLIAKTYPSTTYMDAFVYRLPDEGHIALIQSEGSDGSDYIIHAHNNVVGTLVEYLDYRSLSYTKGLTRQGWTPECSPRCFIT